MKIIWRITNFWAILCILLAFLNILPTLGSVGLRNLGLVQLIKVPACDPDWFVCQVLPHPYPLVTFPGNQATVDEVDTFLKWASRLQPGSALTQIHQAEIAFSLGDRETAAQYLTKIQSENLPASPLLNDNRYEARLVKAHQEAAEGDWDAAVRDFRLGLAWGDERTLQGDERDYFLALVEVEKANIALDPSDTLANYRAGRYLAQSGEWDQAVSLLNAPEFLSSLPDQQAARALFTLGRYGEIRGDLRKSISYYRLALDRDPELRQPYLRLIHLLRDSWQIEQAEELEKKLQALGPTYHLGAQGDNFQAFKPAKVPGGWTLIGYDLDEEML